MNLDFPSNQQGCHLFTELINTIFFVAFILKFCDRYLKLHLIYSKLVQNIQLGHQQYNRGRYASPIYALLSMFFFWQVFPITCQVFLAKQNLYHLLSYEFYITWDTFLFYGKQREDRYSVSIMNLQLTTSFRLLLLCRHLLFVNVFGRSIWLLLCLGCSQQV